jgi:hypothetical protein
MLVSAEPNLHNALLGCYKIALHFGSAETQYPMHRIDQSRGGIDLLRSDEEVYLASKHILLTRKIGGDDNTVSTPLFTIYGLAVTVSSKEWWRPATLKKKIRKLSKCGHLEDKTFLVVSLILSLL